MLQLTQPKPPPHTKLIKQHALSQFHENPLTSTSMTHERNNVASHTRSNYNVNWPSYKHTTMNSLTFKCLHTLFKFNKLEQVAPFYAGNGVNLPFIAKVVWICILQLLRFFSGAINVLISWCLLSSQECSGLRMGGSNISARRLLTISKRLIGTYLLISKMKRQFALRYFLVRSRH